MYTKTKTKKISSGVLIWVSLLVCAHFVTASMTTYELGVDGTGMRRFTADFVDENFATIESDDLSQYSQLRDDVQQYWSDGEEIYVPEGADIKRAQYEEHDRNDTIWVTMHGSVEDINGYLMVIAWFNEEFVVLGLTNGTEGAAVAYSESLDGESITGRIDGNFIEVIFDTDHYDYTEGDDYYVMSVYISDDGEQYTFDYLPKPTGMLSTFGSIFLNPPNLILFLIVALIIIGIIWYAKTR